MNSDLKEKLQTSIDNKYNNDICYEHLNKNKMKNLNRISELENEVKKANTTNVDGRQMVVNACKDLYDLVEDDYHTAGAECLLEGMYADLTAGNFAEPFMCDRKKGKFELYKNIYISNVLPKLNN